MSRKRQHDEDIEHPERRKDDGRRNRPPDEGPNRPMPERQHDDKGPREDREKSE